MEQRLSELGYVEGRNLAIEFRTASGRAERLPELAAELIALRPDVLFVASTQAVMAAKSATQAIPIVMIAAETRLRSGVAVPRVRAWFATASEGVAL